MAAAAETRTTPHPARSARTTRPTGTTRRAAAYLRGRLRSPAGDLPAEDEDLARLIAELVIRAGQLDATPATLELEALQLDLHHLDRRIAAARTEAGAAEVAPLARERQTVLDAIRHRLT